MNKLFTKIAALALGATMAVGVGVAVAKSTDTNPVHAAGSGDWVEVTSLSGLNTTDTYVIANTDNKGKYMNGTVNSGHFQSSDFSASAPASASAAGAFKLETVNAGSNIYKIKLVSTSKYVTATKAGSGGGKVDSASDTSGWKFLYSSNFDAIYQTSYSSKYAAMRCYSGSSWRTYSNGKASSITTTSGTSFKLYKYQEAKTWTVSFAVNTAGYGTVDKSSITNVPNGASITTNGNKVTINGTTVTATPATNTAQYSYAFTGWSNNTGTVTAARTITANFTRTTNTFTVTDSVTHGHLDSTASIAYGNYLDVNIVPDSGYAVPNSVTVTMGGIDVSGDIEYEDGYLYYGPVTGNIVVTATCPAAGNTYSITTNVTNGTYSGDTTITDNGGVASVTIAPTGDYKLPASVSVSGADHTYNASTGVISLSNATGNVTISAVMDPLTEYSITVNETNGSHTGASTIKESRTASLTFTPDSGFGQPASVTVTGATYTWTRGTGVLSLSNPTGNVTVTYEAVGNELDSITLSANSGNYILGDDFIKPTVTAHYTVAAAADVTSSATFTGYDPYTTGNQTVTVSYTEGGITKTATYTASVKAASVTTITTWESAPLSSLTADDVFVIVGDNGSTYAMTNNNGTGSAPGATAVTVTNNKLSADPAATLQWNISGNATDGYTFYPNGSTTTWLYCTATNNGVRVGTNANKTFTISNEGYLLHSGTSRYVGIYNSQDWRCYTSINSNIENQTFSYFKKVETQVGTADLIRITATYTGGEKYVGDPIHTTDFAVKKQLNTGNELFDVASGYTISANTLTSTSNTITVSYTENSITKTTDVVVPATERSATVTSVTLVQGQGVVKDYIDWSGTAWNYTGLTVHCLWSDSTYEDFNLADLIQAGDATVSPVKPAVGVTSFTVSYTYHDVDITSNTVSGITVVADYVESISWTGTKVSHFKAFTGGQLTAAQVGEWSIVPTLAGAGVQSALSFGDYTLKVGTKTISSLPYTWASEDDGQELSITYGKDVDGNDFVKKNATAVGNICATINAIDHEETTTGDQTITLDMTDASAYSKTGTSGTGSETEITLSGFTIWSDKGYAADGESMRVYSGAEFKITSENTIKSVSFTFTGGKTGLTGGTDLSTNEYTETASAQARVVTITIEFEGSVTTTVHYANQMEHFDAQKKVVEFAKFMNTTMNGTNVCSGTFANLESAWGTVADKYDELFGADTTLNATELARAKNMFKYATAVWGSDAEPACVEKAMKTYDYCVGKYGLDPFMDGVRSAERAGNINPITIIGTKSDVNVIAIVVITSVVSLTAIGGYFFLRKRKENI